MKLRTTLGISLILVILAVAGYFLIVQAPSRAARELAEQIRAEFAKTFHFQPEIRVESRTLLSQTQPILELATARKEIQQNHRMEQEWLGSVKVFEIEGRFAARAGYDLREPISFFIDEAAKQIRVTLPPAQLLGLELAGIKVRLDADVWWNKLTAQDRERALAELQAMARTKILESDLLQEARGNLEKSVREIVAQSAPGYSLSFSDGMPTKAR